MSWIKTVFSEPVTILDDAGIKKFSIIFSSLIVLFFGLLLPWLLDFSYPLWPWCLLVIFILWAQVSPYSFRLVYFTWMRLGIFLHMVMTPLILGFTYIFLFIPMGMILRITGKLTIKNGFDQHMDTYRKESTSYKKEQLEKPF